MRRRFEEKAKRRQKPKDRSARLWSLETRVDGRLGNLFWEKWEGGIPLGLVMQEELWHWKLLGDEGILGLEEAGPGSLVRRGERHKQRDWEALTTHLLQNRSGSLLFLFFL